MSKSGFVCEDERRKNVRKPLSKCVEDVFSAEVWLASAPLHEAGKTTRSGNTLKTGIGRGQLSFASDNPSSNPNACPLISTFSKPHSEVASTTHTSALKRFRKDAQRFFLRSSDREFPQANAGFRKWNKRGSLSAKQTLFPAGKLLMFSCRKKVTIRQRSFPFACF